MIIIDFFLQHAYIVINRIKTNFNEEYIILNISTINFPKKSGLINLNINVTTEILERMTMHIKLFYQGDKDYRKEFMRASFDMEKFFNGGVTSFIGMTFLSGLAEAADFPLKFPLKRVICHFIRLQTMISAKNIFKGIYNLRNYTITDQYIKFLVNKDFNVDFRFTGNKKKGLTVMVFYARIEAAISILAD